MMVILELNLTITFILVSKLSLFFNGKWSDTILSNNLWMSSQAKTFSFDINDAQAYEKLCY